MNLLHCWLRGKMHLPSQQGMVSMCAGCFCSRKSGKTMSYTATSWCISTVHGGNASSIAIRSMTETCKL